MQPQKFYLMSGVAAILLFIIGFFFIFPMMYPNYNLPTDSVSQLGALDSPIKTIVNTFGFSLWGILVMICGYGIFKSKILSKAGKLAGLLIILGGFFVYLVGIFPSDGASGVQTMKAVLHNVEHLAFIPIALAFVILMYDFYKNKRLQWLIFPIILLGLTSLGFKYYRFSSILESAQISYSGLVQRTALGLPFVVLALIGWWLWRVESQPSK